MQVVADEQGGIKQHKRFEVAGMTRRGDDGDRAALRATDQRDPPAVDEIPRLGRGKHGFQVFHFISVVSPSLWLPGVPSARFLGPPPAKSNE